MASGVKYIRRGSILGTGALLEVRGVGFRPSKVVVRNANRIMLEWFSPLADDSAFKTVAAGTRTLITSDGIIPLSDGFSLGTDSINGSGEILYWECEE